MKAFRWIAGLLALVMPAPAVAPLAMACSAAPPAAAHCMRQFASVPQAGSAEPCHHAMARPKPPQSPSPGPSFQAASDCCQSHCCCGATTSEWARPGSVQIFHRHLPVAAVASPQDAELLAASFSGPDSARAPPRR